MAVRANRSGAVTGQRGEPPLLAQLCRQVHAPRRAAANNLERSGRITSLLSESRSYDAANGDKLVTIIRCRQQHRVETRH
jgi:hypothetical protein